VNAAFMWQLVRQRRRHLAAVKLIRRFVWNAHGSRRYAAEFRASLRIQRWWRRTSFWVFYRDLVCQVLVKAKVETLRYRTGPAITIQRWWRAMCLRPKPIRTIMRGIVKLQSHCRRRRDAKFVRIWRRIVGVNLWSMKMKRVILVEDKCHKMSYLRDRTAFDGEEDSPAACQPRAPSPGALLRHPRELPASVVDLAQLAPRRREALTEAVGPIHAMAKWYCYLNRIMRIQGLFRGACTRRRVRSYKAAPLKIQCAWRRYVAVRVVTALREEAVLHQKTLDYEHFAREAID